MQMKDALCLFLLTSSSLAATAGANGLDYPKAQRDSQVDVYHGVEVADPYRWLEDADAAPAHAWMEAQETLLASYLAPDRVARLERQIKALGETGFITSVPTRVNGRYFYTVRDPEALHTVIYVRQKAESKGEVVLDPNSFLDDGLQFGGYSVSPTGRYLAYRVSETGARFGQLKIRDLSAEVPASAEGIGRTLPDAIDGIRGATTVWKPDESGFFYVDYGRTTDLKSGKSKAIAQLRFHELGSRGEDVVVFTRPSSEDGEVDTESSTLFALARSGDGRTLVLTVFDGSGASRVLVTDLVADLDVDSIRWKELPGEGQAVYRFLGQRGDRYYLYTNQSAPNGRIVAVDRRRLNAAPVEIVAESREVLAGGSSVGGNAMNLIGDRLVLLYRRATVALIRVFSIDGQLEHEIPLASGWIGSGLVGDDSAPNEVWYSFNGFVEPSTVYRLNLKTGETRRMETRELPVDPDDYVLENVFYESRDGTRVPLFVARKRSTVLNGKNPVFMYGYGLGGWVAVPWYQPQMLAWLEMGGVYALPGVRGGGEYGEAWRDAGIRLNRQNAIDDYIAAAEWLVAERYTSAGQVVANGWSYSGSLAAAAALQRPKLFGAALIGIPLLDMLRYHHFSAFSGWTQTFGSSDDPEEFQALRDYSPYHQVLEAPKDSCAPPMLVTVGENDEVTAPLHGYKFMAALQHQRRTNGAGCEGPVLLKIVRGAGHAFGTTPEGWRRTFAEEMSFLTQVLGMN